MTVAVLPPELRSELHLRPMRHDDAARWAVLLAAVEEVDRRDEHYDTDDCAEELADPDLDLGRDTLIVLDGSAGDEGVDVAYQVLRLRSGGAEGSFVVTDAAVHAAYRRRASAPRSWPWCSTGPVSSTPRCSCGCPRPTRGPSPWLSGPG